MAIIGARANICARLAAKKEAKKEAKKRSDQERKSNLPSMRTTDFFDEAAAERRLCKWLPC